MRHIRIRVELNKGRVGIPLDKLAAITRDTVEFLGSLTQDLGLEEPGRAWLAEHFDNSSVDFDCRFAVPLQEDCALRLGSGLRMVLANDYSDATTAMLIRPETRRRYARIARPLDADEVARFGIYRDGAVESIEWFALTVALAAEIEEPLAGSHRSYGEVQPTVAIAEQARNSRWIHGLALKGADAIHVASALAMKCDELIATDGNGLLNRAEALAKLNLRVCRPSDTKLLPPEFLQENLPLA